MVRVCTQCHAELAANTKGDWCPACGGAVIEQDEIPQPDLPKAEVDHRGIVLPRRYPLGGIITPR